FPNTARSAVDTALSPSTSVDRFVAVSPFGMAVWSARRRLSSIDGAAYGVTDLIHASFEAADAPAAHTSRNALVTSFACVVAVCSAGTGAGESGSVVTAGGADDD